MSTAAVEPDANAKPKRSLLPLLVGLVLAGLGGGGGFMAVRMGLIGGPSGMEEPTADHALTPQVAAAFVVLDPLIINLPDPSGHRFLRFSAQLEVPPEHQSAVESIKPRIVDVLNGYLRAVEVADLERPGALVMLRAQMLRRVQVVAGPGQVRDLLVMEFVLN